MIKQLGVIFSAIVGIMLGWVTVALIRSPVISQTLPVVSMVLPSPTPTPIPRFQPQQLRIPKLGITTVIESVGLEENGAMGVPKEADNVAWYNMGAKPGEKGSAVLAGHYDWYDGPAVFYKLESLEPGDQVEIEDINGQSQVFKVTDVQDYEEDNFPIQEVFSNKDTIRLNLITCSGRYNRSEKNYSHRLVVYTEKDQSI